MILEACQKILRVRIKTPKIFHRKVNGHFIERNINCQSNCLFIALLFPVCYQRRIWFCCICLHVAFSSDTLTNLLLLVSIDVCLVLKPFTDLRRNISELTNLLSTPTCNRNEWWFY